MKNILLITGCKFPNGDAESVRFYSFARSLQNLGYNVLVIGCGPISNKIQNINGVSYISLRTTNRYTSYFCFQYRLKTFLNSYKKNTDIHCAIIGTISTLAYLSMLLYFKRHNISVVKDVVEWFSSKQFKWRWLSLPYLSNTVANTILTNNSIKVIAISRYLQQYFESKKCCTVRIPIYFDLSDFTGIKIVSSEKLKLIYAGTPGKKDYLYVMLIGLSLLRDEEMNRVELNIIGITEKQLELMFSKKKDVYLRIRHLLVVKGRMPREYVLQKILEVDFSILLRDYKARYSQAGFPTKVIESMALGTPVITNYSSDLSDFLVTGENSLIVEKCSSESFSNSIRKALNLSLEQKRHISANAKLCIEKQFNVNSYNSQFKYILE